MIKGKKNDYTIFEPYYFMLILCALSGFLLFSQISTVFECYNTNLLGDPKHK